MRNLTKEYALKQQDADYRKVKAKIIDLTDYSMLPQDGYSSFNREDCVRVLKGMGKIGNDYFIEQDVKPDWWKSNDWKQTWTIRKKAKGIYTTYTYNRCRKKQDE